MSSNIWVDFHHYGIPSESCEATKSRNISEISTFYKTQETSEVSQKTYRWPQERKPELWVERRDKQRSVSGVSECAETGCGAMSFATFTRYGIASGSCEATKTMNTKVLAHFWISDTRGKTEPWVVSGCRNKQRKCWLFWSDWRGVTLRRKCLWEP